jgi:hypothetical protein
MYHPHWGHEPNESSMDETLYPEPEFKRFTTAYLILIPTLCFSVLFARSYFNLSTVTCVWILAPILVIGLALCLFLNPPLSDADALPTTNPALLSSLSIRK